MIIEENVSPDCKELFEPISANLFDTLYPDIESIRIEIIEKGLGGYSYKKKYVLYQKADIGRNIECGNPRCTGGELELKKFVDQMYRRKFKNLNLIQWCQGYKGSPYGKERYGACPNQFEIDIKIEYY
ncbi:MAG: hypothetical protein HND52_20750 [Ignavibacteriae bacterium]|nr:hypothetical protein [Ignavibacteriota bacterium]NOH00402.1 hypothetical protein [Ignavibacteriota bacterium]